MRLDLVDRQYGPAIRACASNLRGLDLGSRRAGMKGIDPSHSYAQTVSAAKKDRGNIWARAAPWYAGPPMPMVHLCMIRQGCSCCPVGTILPTDTIPTSCTGQRQGSSRFQPHCPLSPGSHKRGPRLVPVSAPLGDVGRGDDSQPRMRHLLGPRSPKQRSNRALADTPLPDPITKIPTATAKTYFIGIHKLGYHVRLSFFNLEIHVS